jgi:hypothetical protein
MKRRAALAASLLLTTIAGFVIVAYGTREGLFGGGDDGAGASPQVAAQPLNLPAVPTASPTPIIIEQIVYRDEYIAGQSSSGDGADAPTSPPPASPPATSAPGDTDQPPPPAADEGDDDAPPPALSPGQTLEFSGTITAVDADSMTVATSSGAVTVALLSQTEVHGGTPQPGLGVSVHARVLSDGTTAATEVEVHGGEIEGDD